MAISKKIKDLSLVEKVKNIYYSLDASTDTGYARAEKFRDWGNSDVDIGLINAGAGTNQMLPRMGPDLLGWALIKEKTEYSFGAEISQMLIVKKPKELQLQPEAVCTHIVIAHPQITNAHG